MLRLVAVVAMLVATARVTYSQPADAPVASPEGGEPVATPEGGEPPAQPADAPVATPEGGEPPAPEPDSELPPQPPSPPAPDVAPPGATPASPAIAAVAEPGGDEARARPALVSQGWDLHLTGYAQVESVAWSQDSFDELDPSTGLPLNQERFSIPRARLRAEASRALGPGVVTGVVELDGNTIDGIAQARLLAATVGWAYPAQGVPLLAVTAGLIRTPFGVEVQMRERDKPFLEPPAFARGMFPGNFDGGAMTQGGYGVVRWSIGIVNGSPVADAQWRGRDPLSSYDLVGRLGTVIEGPYRFRVQAGISGLTGTGLSPGTPPTKDDLQWVDENQDGIVQTTELRVIPGSSGAPSQQFDRDALGADLQVHWCVRVLGEGVTFVEAALATNLDRGLVYADPIASSRDLRHAGFAIGIVQNLGRHVQAGVRYDRYDVDRDASERQGLELVQVDKIFSTLAIMASARWADARFVVQYDRHRNPFGRGDDGAPTTRAADQLTLRAQVGF